jgi:hypothetical protein
VACGPSGAWAAAAGLALSAACGARPPRVPTPAPERSGVSSVRVLENPDRKPAPADAVVERMTPAFASDANALPVYPAHALAAGCREGTVAIRVQIGDDGNVSRVEYVPDRPVANDACHSAFWAATSSAVRTWRFAPAFRQTPRPGPDLDGDDRPDFTRWEQSPAAIYLDFEFAFRVVEGRGRVLSR